MSAPTTRHEAFRRRLRERGSLRWEAYQSQMLEDAIMSIAKRPVVTMAPITSIYGAVKIMAKEGIRRIPIVDPETKRLQGIITATDIINFFGGGDKFQLTQRKHSGNFFKAINKPIQFIMTHDVISVETTARISTALELMKKHKIGGLPVIDEDKCVRAIITERDIVSLFISMISGVKVVDLMTRKVVTATPGTSIFEAMKTMIERSLRRLPIVTDKKPIGIITARTILRFFGSSRVFKQLRPGTMAQVLQTSVLEAATKDVTLIKPNIDVGEAVRAMREKNVGSILVVKNERLVGIITERDFFKLIY